MEEVQHSLSLLLSAPAGLWEWHLLPPTGWSGCSSDAIKRLFPTLSVGRCCSRCVCSQSCLCPCTLGCGPLGSIFIQPSQAAMHQATILSCWSTAPTNRQPKILAGQSWRGGWQPVLTFSPGPPQCTIGKVRSRMRVKFWCWWKRRPPGSSKSSIMWGLSTPMPTQKSSASQWRMAVWLIWSGWTKPFQTTDASLRSKPIPAWTAAKRGRRAMRTGCCLKTLDRRAQKALLNKISVHDIYIYCISLTFFPSNSIMYCRDSVISVL